MLKGWISKTSSDVITSFGKDRKTISCEVWVKKVIQASHQIAYEVYGITETSLFMGTLPKIKTTQKYEESRP